MAESFVQVAIDGSGKRVRNVAITAIQADGTTQVVYQQAVSIVDATTGQPFDLMGDAQWKSDVTQLLRAVVRGLAILAEVTEEDLTGEDDSDI